MTQKTLGKISWWLAAAVTALCLLAWKEVRLANGVTLYDVFPLFGLLAFALMWVHFISGGLRRLYGLKHQTSLFWKLSTKLVLVLIIAHPLLLFGLLKKDGFGLPPLSVETVYGSGLMPWVTLGSIALTIFLLFELRPWLRKTSLWKWIDRLQPLAMAAVFVHALKLGAELQVAWFAAVWWMLGVSCALSIGYTIWYDRQKKEDKI